MTTHFMDIKAVTIGDPGGEGKYGAFLHHPDGRMTRCYVRDGKLYTVDLFDHEEGTAVELSSIAIDPHELIKSLL